MPVPWPENHCQIKEVELRGITIQQLRDLRLLLQRLCKTGLLKRSSSARELGWFEVNMYDIVSLVIKPVLQFLGERRSLLEEFRKLSWVELVAESPQKPMVLISHSWGGRFRDFMAAIDEFALVHSFAVTEPIWVCTFAICQFGENFGASLEESPFCKAVNEAKGTVLMVDRDASSLTRIWCAMELHFTRKRGKPLSIFTPCGLVGSSSVTSGPLIEAIREWDVTKCEASQPSDRRQILNYIGNAEEEKAGLMVDDSGGLLLQDGWRKELSNEDIAVSSARTRANGEPEYSHEADLFVRYDDEFKAFNKEIRECVKEGSSNHVYRTEEILRSPRIRDANDQAVTLSQLRSFLKEVKSWAEREGKAWKTLSIRNVVDQYLAKEYKGTSYYRKKVSESGRGEHPQRAQYVMEMALDMPLEEMAQALEWFVEARALRDSTYLHFEILTRISCPDARDRLRHSQDRIAGAQGVIFLWDRNGSSVGRAFLHFALHVSFVSGKQIDFSCASGSLACTSPFLDGGWEFGHFDPEIARKLMEVDPSQGECNWSTARKLLLQEIAKGPGGAAGLGNRLRRIAAGPVLRNCVRKGPDGFNEMNNVLEAAAFSINSSMLRGSLGETPVHIAAAKGHIKSLQCLLENQADPNAEDHIRETPLHYAALAGQGAAVRLLLDYGAIQQMESSFAESALDVANQNLASFLGVDTGRLRGLLEEEPALAIQDEDPGPAELNFKDVQHRSARQIKRLRRGFSVMEGNEPIEVQTTENVP